MPIARKSEIIEDSEPEREALRLQAKLQRHQSRRCPSEVASEREVGLLLREDSSVEFLDEPLTGLNSDFDTGPKNASSSRRVIPMSPRRVSCAIGGRHSEPPNDIINISDESSPPYPPGPLPTLPSPSEVHQIDHKISQLGDMQQCYSRSSSRDSSAGSTSSIMARFACDPPRRAASTRATSTPGTTSETRKMPPPKVSKPRVAKTHALSEELDDSTLGKLLKCVSCDARWTVRKTAFQKVTHMISCSRKSGITRATLKFMILREVGDISQDQSAPVPPVPPPTTLYNTVTGEETKKTTRRPKVTFTLLDVSSAQNNLFDRARSVLGPDRQNNEDHSVRSQAIRSNIPDNFDPPDHTQSFTKSGLATIYRANSVVDYEDSAPSRSPSPPSGTQGFAPSRLGASNDRLRAPEAMSRAGSAESLRNISIPANVLRWSRAESSQPVGVQGGMDGYGGYATAGEGDSAFLHFEPGIEPITEPTIEPATDSEPVNSPSEHPAAPETVEPPKVPKKRKKIKAKAKATDDAEWETNLRESIVSDPELHMRVLRYEPIPMDVFTEKVGLEPNAQTQKVKLRKLLDELGINTYAMTGTTGRRKRY